MEGAQQLNFFTGESPGIAECSWKFKMSRPISWTMAESGSQTPFGSYEVELAISSENV